MLPTSFRPKQGSSSEKTFSRSPPPHPHDVVHKVSLPTRFRPQDNDTKRKILRKRPKNNKKAWMKMSEAILNILRHCWENFICSSLRARLMKRLSASKVHLQPSTWLTGKFPSRRSKFKFSSSVGVGRGLMGNWVWPKGYIHLFSGGWGEGLRGFWQIAHSSYSTHQITSDTHNFPISKDILFCPNLPASKNLPEEQIFWGTDPLGAPVRGTEQGSI